MNLGLSDSYSLFLYDRLKWLWYLAYLYLSVFLSFFSYFRFLYSIFSFSFFFFYSLSLFLSFCFLLSCYYVCLFLYFPIFFFSYWTTPFYFSRSTSEQPQHRYNLHKTLWQREVSANFEIYSHRVYRHRAKGSAIVNVIAQQPPFHPTTLRGKVNISNWSNSTDTILITARFKHHEVDKIAKIKKAGFR